jgi:DNA-binding NtrC family response regulator
MAIMDNVQTVSTGTDLSPSVLVVDDEQNFAALLEMVLTDRGYKVQTAMSGEAALKLAAQAAFDLALLDIRMGQTNGLSLLGELKQRLPKIKVIMITAYPTPDSYRQSFQKGASAFFAKPVDLQELLQTARKLLS